MLTPAHQCGAGGFVAYLPDVVECAQRLQTYFTRIPIRVALALSMNTCRVHVATSHWLGWMVGRVSTAFGAFGARARLTPPTVRPVTTVSGSRNNRPGLIRRGRALPYWSGLMGLWFELVQ